MRRNVLGGCDECTGTEVSKRNSRVSRNRRLVLIVILWTQKKLLTAFFPDRLKQLFNSPFYPGHSFRIAICL